MIPTYVNSSGRTTKDDPTRVVFYAPCHFWSDQYSTLHIKNDKPCCPKCGARCSTMTAEDWFAGRELPRFTEFVKSHRGHCFLGQDFMDQYREWNESTTHTGATP